MSGQKAKIFLADERGYTDNDWFRSYNTFNFGHYQNEHRQPFAGLYVLNDDTLAGNKSFSLTIEENTIILLLPIVGSVGLKTGEDNSIVNAGELQNIYVNKDEVIEFYNPYEDELINFLHLWIKCPLLPSQSKSSLYNFDLGANKNKLVAVTQNGNDAVNNSSLYPIISIGKFAGRHEAVYNFSDNQNSVFVFVIQGAFEVQGRLLHARDGLGLWGSEDDIEVEALSNDAILVVLEMGKNNP